MTVLALLGLFLVKHYNALIALQQGLQQCEADVEVPLRRRLDLIPAIVTTIQGYVDHEHSTLVDLTRARARIEEGDVLDFKAESAISGALGKVMALSEDYPGLRADENFEMLQRELASTENEIAVARLSYNEACAVYNIGRSVFPTVLVAWAFGKITAAHVSRRARV